ncbi:MAG: hypothetical protein ACOC2Q_04520 [Spirochaetota bacterium]
MTSGERRRKVIAHLGRFTGYGIHFHVTMREESGEGRERMMKFRTREKAVRWARATFEREFNPQTHELVFVEDHRAWFYPEGG